MIDFLSSPIAKFFFVPLITILVGLFIKFSSVNDRCQVDNKEWFYLGPDLISAAFLLVFVELCNSVKAMSDNSSFNSGIITALVLCIISILFMPLWIRKIGYKKQPIMQGYNHHFWWGIVVPDVWGLIVLFLILKLLG